MRQLARTLLILGGVTACERAQPVVDTRARPAVGNVGQTGRRAAAIATPLAGASGRPAVGNIGQTGAPPELLPPGPQVVDAAEAARRRDRAQRAQQRRRPVQPRQVAARDVAAQPPTPLAAARGRATATASTPPTATTTAPARASAPPAASATAAPEGTTSAPPAAATAPSRADTPRGAAAVQVAPMVGVVEVARPLVDDRERPMVGNVVRKCAPSCVEGRAYESHYTYLAEHAKTDGDPRDRLRWLGSQIAEARRLLEWQHLRPEQRAGIERGIAAMAASHHELAHALGERGDAPGGTPR